jgi:hypothetical protein
MLGSFGIPTLIPYVAVLLSVVVDAVRLVMQNQRTAEVFAVARERNDMADEKPSTDSVLLRHLHELVAALDHRTPHIERAGEAQIARDAAELKAKALKRIAELEGKAR